MIHSLWYVFFVINVETKFFKEIGTKDDIVLTVFFKQLSNLWINSDVAIELGEGSAW